MFYKQLKNAVDQIHPLKRPFIQNIGLLLIFYLFTLASVHLKPESVLDGLFLLLTITGIITNLAFMTAIQNNQRIYLYYLFWGLGGLYTSVNLFIGVFEMVVINNFSSVIFWTIFITSFIVLTYVYNKGFDEEFLRTNLKKNNSKYSWDINLDINANENRRYGCLVNFVRIFIAPFAPALGMAMSRNFDGQQ